MFIGGEDIKLPKRPIGQPQSEDNAPLQISAEDFVRIERNQKIIMAMLVAIAILILYKK
jgi:hypothetical protein